MKLNLDGKSWNESDELNGEADGSTEVRPESKAAPRPGVEWQNLGTSKLVEFSS